MKLYMFEHCSLCFRVRMTAALKGVALEEIVVLDDDTKTMTDLVGKRQIPILVKDDGTAMLESMDMVDHIDSEGDSIFVGPERDEVGVIAEEILKVSPYLTMPRYPLLDLPEFKTIAAHDHYLVRKREYFDDFILLRAKTREFVDQLMPPLETLDGLIKSPRAVNGSLSKDDIRIMPLLRSVAVVEGLKFPTKVRSYFTTMLKRTGYKALPRI